MSCVAWPESDRPSDRRDEWCERCRRLCAVIGVAVTLILGMGVMCSPSAHAKEPTAEDIARCEREKAAREAWWENTYRQTHPGHVGPVPPNPVPYVCGPVPDDPPALPGLDNTEDTSGRTHHYQGFDSGTNPYEQDMEVGSPRRGLKDRMKSGADDQSDHPDRAQSNVPNVTLWSVSLPDRVVRVVETDDGDVAVVDDQGVTTGEVVVTDPATGEVSLDDREGVGGEKLADPEEPHVVTPEPAPADAPASHEAEHSTPGLPGGVLVSLAGAMAGAAAVVGRRSRVWRKDIEWGKGRTQSLVVLEGPDSPREHRFRMDVPPGGRLVKNADGGVSVYDERGRVVESIRPPWAFDASGRAVPTWFEVDNATGEIVQVIDPMRTTALPVVADPDKSKGTGDESLWDKTKKAGHKGWEKTKSVARAGKNEVRDAGKWVDEKKQQTSDDMHKRAESWGKSDNKAVRLAGKATGVVSDYRDGLYDGAKGMVEGAAPLVGMGEDGGPGVKESWKNGPGALVGASDEVGAKEAWVGVGQDIVAWDEFKQGNYAKGAGKAAFNVGTAGVGGGVSAAGRVGRVGKAARAGSRVERGAKEAGKQGRKVPKEDVPKPKPQGPKGGAEKSVPKSKPHGPTDRVGKQHPLRQGDDATKKPPRGAEKSRPEVHPPLGVGAGAQGVDQAPTDEPEDVSARPVEEIGEWGPSGEKFTDAAREYQEFVTGHPATEAFIVENNGQRVKFDGIDPDYPPNGALVDAKYSYDNFIDEGPGGELEFKGWFQGNKALVKQVRRQHDVANGHPVVWRVATVKTTDMLKHLIIEDAEIEGIEIEYYPMHDN